MTTGENKKFSAFMRELYRHQRRPVKEGVQLFYGCTAGRAEHDDHSIVAETSPRDATETAEIFHLKYRDSTSMIVTRRKKTLPGGHGTATAMPRHEMTKYHVTHEARSALAAPAAPKSSRAPTARCRRASMKRYEDGVGHRECGGVTKKTVIR